MVAFEPDHARTHARTPRVVGSVRTVPEIPLPNRGRPKRGKRPRPQQAHQLFCGRRFFYATDVNDDEFRPSNSAARDSIVFFFLFRRKRTKRNFGARQIFYGGGETPRARLRDIFARLITSESKPDSRILYCKDGFLTEPTFCLLSTRKIRTRVLSRETINIQPRFG